MFTLYTKGLADLSLGQLIGDDHLASRLQMVMAVTEVTATQVAADLDVSVSAVTKWVRTGRIARENLITFSFQYGIDLVWLMTGTGGMFSQSGGRIPRINLSELYSKGPDSNIMFDRSFVHEYEHVKEESGAFPAIILDSKLLEPVAPLGSALIFSEITSAPVEHGDIVLVVEQNNPITNRVFVRLYGESAPGTALYHAPNPLWPDLQGPDFKVAGKAVEIRIPLQCQKKN